MRTGRATRAVSPTAELPPPGVKPLPALEPIVGQAGRDLTRCGFCGAQSVRKNGLCRGHDDLGGAR